MALESSSSPESIPLSSILEQRRKPLMSSSAKLKEQDLGTPLDPLDKPLPPWKLPKLRPSDVFKPDNCLLHALRLQRISNTEFVEGTSEITLNSEKTITIPLMSPALQRSCLNKGVSSIHLGMIQVGIAPLTRRSLNASALACVLDSRVLNFQHALLTAVQAPLEEGPISFSYYPNYGLSLQDPYLNQALKIRIRTSDVVGEGDGRPVKLSIAWQVCYRRQVNDFHIPAVKNSSTTFDGIYFQHSLDGKKTSLKKLDPTQVQIPKRWLEEQKTLIEPVSSSDSTSSQRSILFQELEKIGLTFRSVKEEQSDSQMS